MLRASGILCRAALLLSDSLDLLPVWDLLIPNWMADGRLRARAVSGLSPVLPDICARYEP